MTLNLETLPKGKTTGYLEVAEASTHTVRLPYIVFRGAEPAPTLTVTAGVHSVECAPTEALLRLSETLDPAKIHGTVTLIPVVNTEGFHARTPYHNSLDYLNQNKVFPGDPEGSITRRVADAVFKVFVSKSDYLVDCHSADLGEDATQGMLIYGTDDSRLTEKMLNMARCFNCTHVDTAQIAGNTGEAVNHYGIPCLMTESGAPYPIREKDILYHTEGLINLMKHTGNLDGEPTYGDPAVNPKSHRVAANRGGAWRRQVEAGQRVSHGETLGRVSSLTGETLETVLAPSTGVVSFLRTYYSVNEGDTLLVVAES